MRHRDLRLSRRHLLTGAGALAGAGVLTGCATVPAPGAGSGDLGPEDTSRTLRIQIGELPHTSAVVAEFRRRNPGIPVTALTGGVSFEEGGVQTLLRSGAGPDLLLVNSGPGRVGMLAEAGLVSALDSILAERDIERRYTPEVVEQTRTDAGQRAGGEIFELVEGLDVFQVYYNRTMFDRAGAGVPATWEEFLTACRRLADAGLRPMVAGVRDNFAGGWLLGTLVQSTAGDRTMGEVLLGDGAFDQPSIVEGGRLLRQLIEEGYLDGRQAAALDSDQAQAAFFSGRAAMTVMPQGPLVEHRLDGGDARPYGAFPLPPVRSGAPAKPTAGLALSWVVNNTTNSISSVGRWLDWISSREYLEVAARNNLTLVPARPVPDEVPLDPAVRDGLEKVTAGVGYNPSVYLPDAAKDAWYAAVQGLVIGRLSPAEAMRGVQRALAESR